MMKIRVHKVQDKGMYVEVKNPDGSLFMASPLSLKLPKHNKSMNPLIKVRWENKCRDKITAYMHQKFAKELYGDIEVIVEGLEPEVNNGLK